MESHADITVTSRDGQLVLMVEVKTRLNTSPAWVAQFRKNIFSHGDMPIARYFLFAFPDRLYLWTHNSIERDKFEPDFIIDAAPLLGPYFERAGVLPEKIRGTSFELLLWWWLADLVEDNWEPDEKNAWLKESGLAEAIKNGRVMHEVLV